MVRMIPVAGPDGRIVWVEDEPDVCPAGHEGQLLPTWSPCQVCLHSCRHWRCEACGDLVRDDEHQHRA